MKRLSFLQSVTDIAFVLCLISFAFSVPLVLIHIVAPQMVPEGMRLTVDKVQFEDMNWMHYILLFVEVVCVALYIYAIYLFKQVLKCFQKRKIFNDAPIVYMEQLGKTVLVSFTLQAIAIFVYRFFITHEVTLGTDAVVYSFIALGIGLFFIVLSDVFRMAKNMKEDNDLTI